MYKYNVNMERSLVDSQKRGINIELETIEKKLSSEIKEIALKSGASLVGIVSTKAYDALPTVNVKWESIGYTKKTTDIARAYY